MGNRFFQSIFPGFVLFTLLSCNGCREERKVMPFSDKEYSEQLIEANRKKVAWETDRIHDFMEEKQWVMDSTDTGLFYKFNQRGEGALAKSGSRVTLEYSISLLDGTECYSSKISGPKRIVVGEDDDISGLHEGLLLMRNGDKVTLLIPSHLGYGFTGDQKKIPQNAALVYEVELVALR